MTDSKILHVQGVASETLDREAPASESSSGRKAASGKLV